MLCYSTPKKLLSLQRGDGLYYCKHAVSVYEVLFGVPYGTNKHCLGRSPQSLLPLRRNALKIREEGQSLSTANTHTHTHLAGRLFLFLFPMSLWEKNVSASWWDFHRSAGSTNSNLASRNVKEICSLNPCLAMQLLLQEPFNFFTN